ncbi:PQQ-binding-like beta-propeller repeat protein [Myxococcus sp. AM011]|uniref:outer membrane protein assembly factor BamB family protein n=1 Tax=Myxococcus sp. AM011 TaxID=2745200 RepID=UPI001595ECC4|nr:PQQ-binding-like beta-propeller repeat protein [Myxococcus sp. AM011]NVJ25043.1 PQQ-binding-like beta-propeller repeat protein [Myxococcus sp. AM011]
MNSLPHPSALLVTAFNGLVVAYDRASGGTAWTFSVPGKSVPGVRPRPTHVEVHDGRVFVFAAGSDGVLKKRVFVDVHALDHESGRPLWTQRVAAAHAPDFTSAVVLVDAGQVIVSYHEVLVAFAADTGEPQWTRSSEHGDGGVYSLQLQLGVHGGRGRPLT